MTVATVATWNVEWSPIDSGRGKVIRAFLDERSPDVTCLTEVIAGFLPGGHVIEAEADYGYSSCDGRRKVAIWSENPWREICRGRHLEFPGGRLVSGLTDTPIGPLRVVGVCIPWRDAHVRTGRRDRKPWEDHLQYLHVLKTYLAEFDDRTVVIGDFNQRVPKAGQPDEVYDLLMQCFDRRLEVVTSGLVDAKGAKAIDHLAVSQDLHLGALEILPAKSHGIRLSDHFGFVATVESRLN